MRTLRELYRDDVLRARRDREYLLRLLEETLPVLQGDAKSDDYENLTDEIETLVRPLEAAVHITWSDRAICHFTTVASSEWPPELRGVPLHEFVKSMQHDGKREVIAYPSKDWSGVTCDACRVRLPILVQEINEINFADAITAGVRATHEEAP